MNGRRLLVALSLLLASFLVPTPPLPGNTDKALHVVAGVVVGWVASSRLGPKRGVPAAVVALAGVELLQAAVPHRTASGADLLAGAAGVALAVAVAWYVRRRRRLSV